MIHKSNPYNVKPLPKLKKVSFGRFGKISAVSITRQKELKRKPKKVIYNVSFTVKTHKGVKKVFGWRNPVKEAIKIIPWTRK